MAVWAYNAGGDFDIAFSEWDGTEWTATDFLTASTDDERDPRLFVEPDGTVHVVWWAPGPSERVCLATRETGSSTWGLPVEVTSGTENGRRPSVTVFNGELSVAYERGSATPGMVQDVVIATRQPGRGFVFETIGATARTEALDVVLHAEQGTCGPTGSTKSASSAAPNTRRGPAGPGTRPSRGPTRPGSESKRRGRRSGARS